MPELPEVRTVAKYLNENIIGQKIMNIEMSNLKSFRNCNKKQIDNLTNQKILSVETIAKHLILKMNDYYLILHLRMEGKLFVFKDDVEMNNLTNRFHDVMIINTDKGLILFQDTRRFATVDLFNNEVSYEENPILVKVGPEPFNTDAKYLFSKLSKKNTQIKNSLLDQSIISGLGNIYVDEVIHSIGVLPTTISKDITIEQCKLIITNSRKILKKAIINNGTTIRSYTSSLGVEGSYQKYLNVHQQTNCRVCGTKITKIKVGGRGTYYCTKCQS